MPLKKGRSSNQLPSGNESKSKGKGGRSKPKKRRTDKPANEKEPTTPFGPRSDRDGGGKAGVSRKGDKPKHRGGASLPVAMSLKKEAQGKRAESGYPNITGKYHGEKSVSTGLVDRWEGGDIPRDKKGAGGAEGGLSGEKEPCKRKRGHRV